jgi:hypothetical protein
MKEIGDFLESEMHSASVAEFRGGFFVKIFMVLALLTAILMAVVIGFESEAMATIARTFCAASTGIFACAATLGLASRSRI